MYFSDSGIINEESAVLNFMAISICQSMEQPETLNAKTIILSGFYPQGCSIPLPLWLRSISVVAIKTLLITT